MHNLKRHGGIGTIKYQKKSAKDGEKDFRGKKKQKFDHGPVTVHSNVMMTRQTNPTKAPLFTVKFVRNPHPKTLLAIK